MSTFIQCLMKESDSPDLPSYLNKHLTVIDLLDQFKIMLEQKFHNKIKVLTDNERKRLEYLIKECEGWSDYDINVVEDEN